MNAFQILDENKVAISLNKIDAVVAKFWGVEVQKKNYATHITQGEDESYMSFVRREHGSNWFDVVGFSIAKQGDYTSGWRNVALAMLEDANLALISEDMVLSMNTERLENLMEFYKPYIELMNHFKSLGWTPHQVVE